MSNKITTYLKESREELRKVVWPSKKETRNHTLLVIGITLGVAAVLGLFDFLFNLGLSKIIK
jgi:preprotein translocase subunit SecE